MNLKQKQLRRLIENSFPEIEDFYQQVQVDFELLENAKSFWSEIYVAYLSSETINNIPTSLFIKLPKLTDNLNKASKNDESERFHQLLCDNVKRENEFYKIFGNADIPDFPMTKIYNTEDITDEATGGIVAENLNKLVYSTEYVPGLNEMQIYRILDALAGWHSYTHKMEDAQEVCSKFPTIYTEVFQSMMYNECLGLETLYPELFPAGKIEKLKWAFDIDLVNASLNRSHSTLPHVLFHSDLNCTNLLWNKNSHTNDLRAIIDFQGVQHGSLAYDIVRLFTLGLSMEQRRQNTNKYLKYYYDKLSANFNGKPPCSFEQIKKEYNNIFATSSNFSLFGISVYCKMYKQGNLGHSEEERELCTKELLSRAVGIVEDIESLKPFYHLNNNDINIS